MAVINAHGLCTATSTGLGRSVLTHHASGIAECEAECFGQGKIDHGASGLAECIATCLGHLTKPVEIASVTNISSTKVRVTFDRAMTKDAALEDINNYNLYPAGVGASIVWTSVIPEDVVEPTYVDIVTSEMTDGATYEIEIEEGISGPTDTEGVHFSSSSNKKTWVGLGVDPLLSYVESLGQNLVKVVFNEDMHDNDIIRNKDHYSFDNGLTVTSVEDVDGDTVYLNTSDQISGLLYELTINQY